MNNPLDDLSQVEKAILTVLLNEPEALAHITEVLPDARFFAGPTYRDVYRAMLELSSGGIPPTIASVAGHLGLPLHDVQAMALGYNQRDARELIYLAEHVAREGQRRLLRDALNDALSLTDIQTQDLPGMAYTIMQMIAGTSAQIDGKRDHSTAAVDRDLEAMWDLTARSGGIMGASTGLQWLDLKTRGMCPSTIWMLTGPYKNGRKTTCLRNLALAACKAGKSFTFFALEGDRLTTYAGLIAMLATERLLAWKKPTEAFLSDFYVKVGTRFTEAQAAAIAEARAELKTYNLRVYEMRDHLGTTDALTQHLRSEKMFHGLDIFGVDYLQLVGTEKLFERVERACKCFQSIATELELCALLIAQLNEGTIAQIGNTGDASYSPGVKGGGDPAASADFLFRSLVDAGDPSILTIELKLSRHSRPGVFKVRLNEQSGKIIQQFNDPADLA